MENRELKKRVDRILEISYAFLGRFAIKNTVGIDASPLRRTLKKIRDGKTYNPDAALKYLIPLKDFFEELGYRYKELADDVEYIIKHVKKEKEKKLCKQ